MTIQICLNIYAPSVPSLFTNRSKSNEIYHILHKGQKLHIYDYVANDEVLCNVMSSNKKTLRLFTILRASR